MKKYIISSLIIFAVGSVLFGQNSRMGSASSTQLLIVPGAKHLSGGGAAANAAGIDAAYWNPAGLVNSENNTDVIFSNRQYIADIDNNLFGIATTFGDYKLGVNVRTYNIGDIKETTVYYPDGTGQVFTPNFSVIGSTISRKLSDNTSVGLNANYVRESFGRVAASGFAYDLGVQYKNLLGREGLDVGFVLKNFGKPIKYDGEGLGVFANAAGSDRPVDYYKVDAASFDLPFTFDMAVVYNIAGADIGATYTSNYYSTDEMKFNVSYGIGPAKVAVGMQTSVKAQEIEDADDWYTNPSDGVSFGFSLDVSQYVGANLSVDYSMLPMGDFGTNSIVALRLGI